MTRAAAFFWLPLGFIVSVIDGWLSMLSLLGLMHPDNALGYVSAAAAGIGLTLYAVLFPVARGPRTATIFVAAWGVLVVFDIATSVLGSIWYGVMNKSLSSSIEVSQMSYDPDNWVETLIFVGVVLGAAYSCHKLGEAMKSFMR